VLGERYRIVGLLGRGGMGEVYRADDLKLEQTVALKFLPLALEGDADRLERLYGEVRMARQVSHPAVCRVWDIGEAEGQHFLSMEFVDGENLSSLLRRIGRFPADKALDVARQVCAGLAAAHEKGVLHRDLKPANVMLDGQGKARLTDFGLAGVAEALSRADVRSGTPSYMSPEQLQGREVTVRSDIYALGLLIYELVTGRRAFEGKGLAELTRKHRDERPIEPSAIVPDLDPAVERTIFACLEKDPKRRPSSALVVAAMLSGRDPLEAAIAAGETPSPELVAAAGESEGLRPRAAWACLGFVVLGVLLQPALRAPQHLLKRVPVEKSPAALEDRARELIARLGVTAPASDREVGLRVDEDYRAWAEKRDRSATRWSSLASGQPPVLAYWYRRSPRPLTTLYISGRVDWEQPPIQVSGMAGAAYDLRGHLVSFYSVPAQVESGGGPAAEPDWSILFQEARLDPGRLRRVDPRWTPPFYADTRAAWEGTWPQRPEIALRVEAAAHRGRPVWFEVVSPWTRPGRQELPPRAYEERTAQVIAILLLVSLTTAGAVLARRNIALGRGDRRGAFRLALALAALATAAWVLRAHHVLDPMGEVELVARGVGFAVLIAALIWLFYLALEPYVRRLRPWTLISWTRLLGGGLRDAVVGRDVLIGMTWGMTLGFFDLFTRWALVALGRPEPAPELGALDALLGTGRLLTWVVGLPVNATLLGLGTLLLFLLLHLLTRRDAPAVALLVVILSTFSLTGSDDRVWLLVLVVLAVWGSFAAVLLRFGVLAAITGIYVANLLALPPLFYDFGEWTGAAAVVVVPLLLTIAFVAFRSAVAGPSGLRRYAAGDVSSSHPA
jgi:serine/threonine-protein kinase